MNTSKNNTLVHSSRRLSHLLGSLRISPIPAEASNWFNATVNTINSSES